VDLEVKVDLMELQEEFHRMTDSQLIGVVTDQAAIGHSHLPAAL
jgi:hypothetical protein